MYSKWPPSYRPRQEHGAHEDLHLPRVASNEAIRLKRCSETPSRAEVPTCHEDLHTQKVKPSVPISFRMALIAACASTYLKPPPTTATDIISIPYLRRVPKQQVEIRMETSPCAATVTVCKKVLPSSKKWPEVPAEGIR